MRSQYDVTEVPGPRPQDELAHEVITGTMKLSSVRARRNLEPLATALQASPRRDHHDLARAAHHVATSRV